MLPSRVSVPSPPHQSQEDIFSSSISNLFTDDTQNSHGTPGHAVVYHSDRYGEIKLGIPKHPDVEEGRKLFAHYLWNAGVVAADAIENASCDNSGSTTNPGQENGSVIWDRRYWNMRGKDVLELGAGTALPSIISAKSHARSITITDHSSSPAITTNTISQNVYDNLKGLKAGTTSTKTTIAGLTWGDPFFTSPTQYGKLLNPQPAQKSFDRLIVADCLWLPSQHLNIVKTIDLWLRDTPTSINDSDSNATSSPPCALVVAGFHTGRSTVASFFEIATGTDHKDETQNKDQKITEQEGNAHTNTTLSIAQIFEVDVNLNVRDWVTEREGETKEQLKRWCVCAVLVRKD